MLELVEETFNEIAFAVEGESRMRAGFSVGPTLTRQGPRRLGAITQGMVSSGPQRSAGKATPQIILLRTVILL
jgi:hypothetical protein